MPRYRLTIAYDGTDFCGWQKQEPLSADHEPLGSGVPGCTPAAYSSETPLIPTTRAGRVALRTVQGVVEQAVREVVREPVELIGASRTDSGVHARGQVAAFTCSPLSDTPATHAPLPAVAQDEARRIVALADGVHSPVTQRGAGWPLERGADRLMMAVNSRLPEDVQVVAVAPCAPTFDPIGDATSKGYSYTLHVGRERPLWERRYVHHLAHASINVEAMHEAAQTLVGEHDFAAFAAAGHGRLSTVRTVLACSVRVVNDAHEGAQAGRHDDIEACTPRLVRIDISGNGFLWNMVRIVVGTLVQVGLGRRAPSDVARTLASRDRTQAGPTMGPEGLCLEWIRYARA